MSIIVKTAELPLHKFKFVMKSSDITRHQAIHIIAEKFETAVSAARNEDTTHQADIAFARVEAE